MAINNIPRTATIDEWRIQTNQSANALNTLETGDYTKSNGTLTLNANSKLVITANGTALQVANTVLFQTRLEVGNVIALGVRESGTGNLSVGNTTFIYGQGTALFVANNATVNNNLLVTNTLSTTTINANGSVTIARDLVMTNTGNVIFANTGSANIKTIYVTDEYAKSIYSGIVDVENYVDVGANISVATSADIGTFADIGTHGLFGTYIQTGSFANVGSYLKTTSNVAVGSYLDVTSNASIGTTLVVTSNTTSGNFNTTNAVSSGTLRVSDSGTIGTTLVVTGNTTSGNFNTTNAVSSGTLRVSGAGTIGGSLGVTGDTTLTGDLAVNGGDITTTSSTFNLINTNATVINVGGAASTINIGNTNVAITTTNVRGNLVVTGNLVSISNGSLTIAGNTQLGHGTLTTQILSVGTSGTIGTTLVVTGNTTSGNFNTTNAVSSGTLRVSDSGTIGTTLVVTGNTTSGNFNTTNAVSSGTLRVSGAGTIGGSLGVTGDTTLTGDLAVNGGDITTTATTINVFNTTATTINFANAATTVNIGNSNIAMTTTNVRGNLVVTGNLVSISNGSLTIAGNTQLGHGTLTTQILSVGTSGTIGTTLTVTQNVISGNLNTSGAANSRTLNVVNSGTIGTDLTVGGTLLVKGSSTFEGSVGIDGSLEVDGNFVIAGSLLYDTEDFVLKGNNAITTGTASFQVNRHPNVNASIRWSETDKYWALANVAGSDYSRILTESLVNDDISSISQIRPASARLANTLNQRITDLTTANITESPTNLYLTQTRVRANISNTAPINYNVTTGNISHATSGVTEGTHGSASQVPVIVVNTTGHVTSVTNTSISIAASQVSSGVFPFSRGGTNATSYSTGNLLVSNGTAIVSLANTGTAAIYGNSSHIPVITTDGYGRVSGASNIAIRVATTSETGIVLLQDSVSTSTTNAATPNSVKTAFDSLNSSKYDKTGGTISGDVVVTGNLTISGLTTYANTQTLLIGDNILTLNADLPSGVAPSENAGIEINRGNQTNTYIRWDEGIDAWVANNGISGNEYRIANSTTHLAEGNNLYFTTARARTSLSATTPISYDSGTGVISHAVSGVTAGTYANASHVPVVTVDSTGHVTGVTNTAISIAASQIGSGTLPIARGGTNQTSFTTGNIVIFDGTSLTSIANTGTAGTYANASHVPVITTDAYGRVSGVTNTAIAIAAAAVSGLAASATTDTTNAANIGSGVLNVLRLPTTGTAGTYANNWHIPQITTDAYGRVTGVTNTAIRSASTTETGIVQLTDSISSTLTTTAATPNSVKTAYDLAAGKLSSITITNGTGISGGGTGSSFTLSIGQSVATTANVQFRTIGVGTAADTTSEGSIRATGNVVAGYSDERLKQDIVIISNALDKVNSIRGVHYMPNDVAVSYGYKKHKNVGVIAQDIEKVLPEVVVAAPFDTDENGNSKSGENYKTVQYDKLVPLLIEAIKELSKEVEDLKKQINK